MESGLAQTPAPRPVLGVVCPRAVGVLGPLPFLPPRVSRRLGCFVGLRQRVLVCAGARAGRRGSACALSGSRCTLDYLPHPDLEASRTADELQGRTEVHGKNAFSTDDTRPRKGSEGPRPAACGKKGGKGSPHSARALDAWWDFGSASSCARELGRDFAAVPARFRAPDAH